MSNYLGRKAEFTPSVYTRYFERRDTQKSANGHVFFNENEEELSETYQNKRDILFKRLFPSKYADSNNNQTESDNINQNGNKCSLTNTTQSLGDYISLSNDNSSTHQKRSLSPETDIALSSENDDDDLSNEQPTIFPSMKHESIIGHVHHRSTIENVRAILIRELYERTNDPNTEWLKCKMNIPKDYINRKYYADFQRRYKKEIQKNTKKTKKKSISNSSMFDLTETKTTTTTTIQIDETPEKNNMMKTLSIIPSNSPTEYIILDSDEDNHQIDDIKSKYFIDRSSTLSTSNSQSVSQSIEDYQKEDSKYAQLPTRNTSSPIIIRPIISKNQRRKKHRSINSSEPLVSAIDRIIDQMDQSDTFDNSQTIEQQNLLIKEIKKRKKKKKNKLQTSTNI